jgi:hypothetical protein
MIAQFLAAIYLVGGLEFLDHIGAERGFDPLSGVAALFFLAAGVPIYIAAHEGGHRIAGAAMGWRCIRFGFGPFEFFRKDKGWKRERVKMLWGAFVRQVPPSFTHFRGEKATTLLSGPVSSLFFGLLFISIAMASSTSTTFALFGRLGLLSFLGFLELIPYEKNGIGSDGYRLWQVLRGGEAIDDMFRDSVAEASNFTPLRFREWPREPILRLAKQDDPYNIYLAYLHTLDAGDTQAAAGYMRRFIAYLPGNLGPHFGCEAAYWLAMYGDDAEAARTWMEFAGQDVDAEVRLRATAAVAWAEGQPDRAESLANESLAQIETPPSGSAAFEIEQLTHLLASVAHARVARS